MEIKIPIYKIDVIKKLFRKPIYVFEVPFVYPNETPINDIIYKTYIVESDKDRLKYGSVSNVRMHVKVSEYEKFIKNITKYYKAIRMEHPKYIQEILRKSAYISHWVNADKQVDILV